MYPSSDQLNELADQQAERKPKRITIVTCMKNEGPFILEWIAYHRSIGVTDFVIFTNDCTDGTDLILNRLDAMGVVFHLPNPALFGKRNYFQPNALKFAFQMPFVYQSDVIISMDVDEFIAVRVGDGSLNALFDTVGPFHLLSMLEVNFSSSRHIDFSPGWVTEQFRYHDFLYPWIGQAYRGVKTIIRAPAALEQISNHRPHIRKEFQASTVWRDGSGNLLDHEFISSGNIRGMNCQGRYKYVALNHYSLRSLDSYIAKIFRGRAVKINHTIGHDYYLKRGTGQYKQVVIQPMLRNAKAEYDELIKDQKLADLQAFAETQHQLYIDEALKDPHCAMVKEIIMEKMFRAEYPKPEETLT